MGAVELGITYGRRDLAQTPRVQIQNMILEPNPTNQVDKKTWIIRPGVEVYPSPNTGHLRGLAHSTSGYPNRFFFVMGQTLYIRDLDFNASFELGSIAGNGPAIFAYHS